MIYAVCVAKRASVFLSALVLVSCASKGVAPVLSRETDRSGNHRVETAHTDSTKAGTVQQQRSHGSQGFHIVRKGDTLYSIAWNYGFDYREVAAWNAINKPYLIFPGQVIRLKPAPVSKSPVLQPGPVVDKSTAVVNAEKSPDPVRPVNLKNTVAPEVAGQSDIVNWHWPVRGKIVKSGSPTSKKGVDISGRLGQDIKAAAQGDVVYSGSGLLGYGRLIIIKHNEKFLSAYAYNSELLVREGESVSTGQTIAKMGKSSTGQALLHFEIRKNGKSVNPLKLLPKS